MGLRVMIFYILEIEMYYIHLHIFIYRLFLLIFIYIGLLEGNKLFFYFSNEFSGHGRYYFLLNSYQKSEMSLYLPINSKHPKKISK